MPKGISINIGLNGVNPDDYNGWDGTLIACESDAQDMANIARAKGFNVQLLLTANATYAKVKGAIKDAAQILKSGDILFLSYSGHGGQVPDTNGDEPDGKDETWVLYDREIIDDELYRLWSQFQPGVRIFVLSDSCHSGSIIRLEKYKKLWSVTPLPHNPNGETISRFRAIPDDVQNAHYERNKAIYIQAQADNPQGNNAVIGASVILISACQDNQLAGDGGRNGVFTGMLRYVWANGTFSGTYLQFYLQITDIMPGQQTPNYLKVGAPNPTFEAQTPFSIYKPLG